MGYVKKKNGTLVFSGTDRLSILPREISLIKTMYELLIFLIRFKTIQF